MSCVANEPLQLFTIGVCGAIGTDDLLACFVAGNALNWGGQYLEEADKRHDEVNSSFDVLLNFGGFMYIGTIFPWRDFHMPDTTGITLGRLFALGFMIIIFRRIPAIFMTYRAMPRCVKDWKEALFMGYFGPIGTCSPPIALLRANSHAQASAPYSTSSIPATSFLSPAKQ